MPIMLDNAMVTLGDWHYVNNVWNKRSAINGTDYRQSMTIDPGKGMRVEWQWPSPSDAVRAYPEVMLGRSPWTTEASTTPFLPVRLAEVDHMAIDFALDWQAPEDAAFNLAFEFWLSSDPDGGSAAITDEVMVWIRTGNFDPGGTRIAAYADKNGSGVIYRTDQHGDASGASSHHWALTTLDYDRDLMTGTIELDAMLDDLVQRGLIGEDRTLMNVEFGAEVVSGGGSYTVHELAITYGDGSKGILDLSGH